MSAITKQKRKMHLSTQIFISMIVGILLGFVFPDFAVSLKFLGDLFIRAIKMIVVPVIFSCIVVGVAGAGDFKRLGRLGLKTILWFEFATTIALLLGLISVNLLKPGVGLNITASAADLAAAKAAASKSIDLGQYFLNIIPTNVIDSMARQDMLQVVVFATIFGVATAAMGNVGKPMVEFANTVAQIMFKFTGYIMKLAPLGIGAMMAWTVGKFGLGMLIPLGKLILTMYGSLLFFIIVVLGGAAAISGISFWRMFNAAKEPFMIAFTTTTGEVAIPIAIQRLEQSGVPKFISSFVIPTGYSFNMDGSTLYIAGAAMFIAQAYGIELSLAQQVMICLTLMLATKGVAGIPGGGFIVLAGTLSTIGLPVEGLALILGIDRVLDMARSGCNMFGHCVASFLVARWEKVLGDPVSESAADVLGDAPSQLAEPAVVGVGEQD
jgi:proton glutamate symport protein